MKPKPLGCLTLTGILAAAFTLLIVGGWTIVKGGTLYSPGPLNTQAGNQALGGVHSHAELSNNCSACHANPVSGQVMADRCLICHTDLVDNPKDFHKVMLAQASSSNSCNGCHTDHNGAQASLTHTSLAKFPHDQVGFSLHAHKKRTDGAPFACSDCHSQTITKLDVSVCETCHQKIDASFAKDHLQAFGAGCLACHDGLDTYGKNFDHSKVAFQLAGKHNNVPCYKCHSQAHTIAELKATPTDCASCHAKDDRHKGGFGKDCGACHTPEDWKKASFDHTKAAFQLTAAHVKVACEKCHVNNVFKGTPQDCYSCHAQIDAHQGKFGKNCAGCHTTDDWKKATFDHSKTSFQLTGAHANVPCEKCHVNNVFKGTPQNCAACHPDPAFHYGLFGTDCKYCHTTAAWSPGQFNQAHDFPLSHGGATACANCHPNNLLTYNCYSCHNQSQTIARHQGEGIGNLDNCIRCHPSGQGGG